MSNSMLPTAQALTARTVEVQPDWHSAAICAQGLLESAGVGATEALSNRLQDPRGRAELAESALCATACGTIVPLWRNLPWTAAASLCGLAGLYLVSRFDRSNLSNRSLHSALSHIISQGKVTEDARRALSLTVGNEALNLAWDSAFFVTGALSRKARLPLSDFTIKGAELWRTYFETSRPVMEGFTEAKSQDARAEEWGAFAARLKRSGLRANLTFEDGRPSLQLPCLSETSCTPARLEADWWRDPTHPFWKRTEL